MFNIGWTEFLLIAIVFLIFIRPNDFPLFIRSIIRIYYKIKDYIATFSDDIKNEIYLDEFKKKNKEILKIEKELKKLKKK